MYKTNRSNQRLGVRSLGGQKPEKPEEVNKPMSAWDRRKQYMQKMRGRPSARIKTQKRSLTIVPSTNMQNIQSQHIKVDDKISEKENIPNTPNPKRLCRSASYTILPSEKSFANDIAETQSTKLVIATNPTSVTPIVTPTLDHPTSDTEITLHNNGSRKRRRSETKSNENEERCAKIVQTSVQATQSSHAAAAAKPVPEKRRVSRIVASRYMQGIFTNSRRQTLETRQPSRPSFAKPQFSNVRTSTNNLASRVSLKSGAVARPSTVTPKQTRTSLLRLKMRKVIPFPLDTNKIAISNDSVFCLSNAEHFKASVSEVQEASVTINCTTGSKVLSSNLENINELPQSHAVPLGSEGFCTSFLDDDGNSTAATPKPMESVVKSSETTSVHKPKSVKFSLPENSFFSPNVTIRKTPKKGLTLRERFEVWMAGSSISPSKYRHIHCFGLQLSDLKTKQKSKRTSTKKSFEEGKEACSSKQDTVSLAKFNETLGCIDVEVKKVLSELRVMLNEGYNPRDVSEWLLELKESTPQIVKLVSYWECKALASWHSGNLDEALETFNEAAEQGVDPIEELAAALSAFLNSVPAQEMQNENSAPVGTRTADENVQNQLECSGAVARSPLLDRSNVISSTLIRYNVDRTPTVFKNVSKALDFKSPTEYPAIVTPVRRSGRLFAKSLSTGCSGDQGDCVDSVAHLPAKMQQQVLFRKNGWLEDI